MILSPFAVPSMVLLTMTLVSLIFSLSSEFKFRALSKFPKNLPVTVFNKTFNVFNPYPDHKKTIHRYISILPFLVMLAAFFFTFFLTVRIFEMGLALGFIVLLICLGLTILDETFEVFKNADIFAKALKNGVGLGQGDLNALAVLKESLPKFKAYYLSLAIVFLSSSVTLPYLLSAISMIASGVFSAVSSLSIISDLAPFFALALFILATVIVQILVRKIIDRIFGFLKSEPTTPAVKGTCRMPTE